MRRHSSEFNPHLFFSPRFEDAIDAFVMIFNGNQGHTGKYENNYWLLGWTLGNMCSIAVFNWAGITVAKKVDATTRAVLDQLRTVIIWATFLIPFGASLCRVQQYFDFTAVGNDHYLHII